MDGGVGWGGVGWEVAKIPVWDTPWTAMTPKQWPMTHQWTKHSQWEQTQVAIAQLASSMGASVSDMTLEAWQNAF